MAKLDDIVAYMGRYLRIDEIADYPDAFNGLQLENRGEVTKLGAAVDACLPVFERAVERGVNLLLVHHGLFWGGVKRIEGGYYRKLKIAIDGDLAVYSAHLPLDAHPDVGNNAVLAKALGLETVAPFFESKGHSLGLRAIVDMNLEDLKNAVSHAVGGGPVHVCPGGPDRVREIGIVTGGAGGDIAKAAREGVDTFVTGEGPHWSYTAAEELGVNLLYAGHYATETFGVKALAEHLANREGLDWEFIDHPTGL